MRTGARWYERSILSKCPDNVQGVRTFHVAANGVGEANGAAVLIPDGTDAVQRAWRHNDMLRDGAGPQSRYSVTCNAELTCEGVLRGWQSGPSVQIIFPVTNQDICKQWAGQDVA